MDDEGAGIDRAERACGLPQGAGGGAQSGMARGAVAVLPGIRRVLRQNAAHDGRGRKNAAVHRVVLHWSLLSNRYFWWVLKACSFHDRTSIQRL